MSRKKLFFEKEKRIWSWDRSYKKVFKNLWLLVFLTSSFFVLSVTIANAAGPTYVTKDIDEPTIWTLENSPYIIRSGGHIDLYDILTIEPGVVVKSGMDNTHRGGIYVHGDQGGQLLALGTEEEPIVFTSYYDNDHDNLIGTSKGPENDLWRGLHFKNDESKLDHTIVRYTSGKTSIGALNFHDNSQTKVTNSILEKNTQDVIKVFAGAKPVLDSLTIKDNHTFVIHTEGDCQVTLRNSEIEDNHEQSGVFKIDINSELNLEDNIIENNAYDTAHLYGNLENQSTVKNIGLAYYVPGTLEIKSGGRLDIEPSVVFKMVQRIENYGEIHASGTVDDPIVFTSIFDNSHDSAGAPPQYTDRDPIPGDWQSIRFENNNQASSTISHTKFHYGGKYYTDSWVYPTPASSLYIEDAIVEMDHVGVYDNDRNAAIHFEGSGTFTLESSEILDSQNHGVYIDFDSDFTSMPVIKDNLISGNVHTGLSYANRDDLTLDATDNDWGHESGPNHPDNPEGQGDKITVYSGDVLFDPWIGKPSGLDPVILIPGIMGSWEVGGTWQIDPILNTYDDLWQAFQNAGYEVNKNLFAFPYQWRNSNRLTAQILKNKIDEIQKQTGAMKVDIVAHSMGGLVTRYYIENELFLQDNDGQDEIDIDQVIFIGTPHRGATKSYLTWEAGEIGPSFRDLISEKIFLAEAHHHGYDSLFGYIHEYPFYSVQELLPIFDYIKDKDTDILRSYPNNCPRNEFLEDLNSTNKLAKINLVRGINLVSKRGEDSTIDTLRVVNSDIFVNGKWEHGYPDDYNSVNPYSDNGLEMNEGDETVPFRSNDIFANFETVFVSGNHSGMVKESQEIIIKELTGQDLQEISDLSLVEKILFVRVYSPIDIQIISPDGKRLGKNFETGEIFDEIPGAFYSGYDGVPEFIVIPDPGDGEYEIQTQGTGNGEFGLGIAYIDGEQEEVKEEKILGMKTEFGLVDSFNLNLSGNSEIVLEPEDNIPPTINVASPESKDYLHSDQIIIDYSVTDDISGVNSVSQYLDDEISEENEIDLFFLDPGSHFYRIGAFDRLGNGASTTIEFEVVANWESLKKDIERMDSMGWFKNKGVKISLLNLVKVSEAWYHKYNKLKNPRIKETVKRILIWKMSLLEKKIQKTEKKHLISEEARDMLLKQVKYIINNL